MNDNVRQPTIHLQECSAVFFHCFDFTVHDFLSTSLYVISNLTGEGFQNGSILKLLAPPKCDSMLLKLRKFENWRLGGCVGTGGCVGAPKKKSNSP